MQSCWWTPTFWTNMPPWEWSHVEDCKVNTNRLQRMWSLRIHKSLRLSCISCSPFLWLGLGFINIHSPWKLHVPLILWYPQTRLQCHNPHNHNCLKDYRPLQLLRKHNNVTQEAHLCHASAQNEPKFKSLLQSSFPKFRFDAESSWFQKFLTGTQT